MLREKIRFTGNDINIKIPLGTKTELSGQQGSIDNFVEEKTGLSINAAEDGEIFRYLPNSQYSYKFSFYNGVNHDSLITRAGFTITDLSYKQQFVLRSFYAMQIFDNFDSFNQNRIHNGYYNGFTFINNDTNSSQYQLDGTVEFTNLYIPNNFINSFTGTTISVYARFYFYNAKTGQLHVFYNKDNENLTTDARIFIKIDLDMETKTYSYTEGSGTLLTLKEFENDDYVDSINATIASQDISRPNYPLTGTNVLLNSEGKYELI